MPPKKKAGKSKDNEEEALTRIAIVTPEKCKPKKCNQECKKSCPVVKLGKLCIEVTPKSKLAFISEPLCIGKCDAQLDDECRSAVVLWLPRCLHVFCSC